MYLTGVHVGATRESSAQRDLLLSLVEQVVHLVAFDNLQ